MVGVISLPAGVFQPYSGVKTSILILDKELNQKSDRIFFAKVENDGFSLGAQRTPIAKNDLPNLVSIIQNQSKDELFTASKTTILGNTSVSLSQSKYQTIDASVSDYPMIKIGDLFTTSSGGTPKAKEQKYYENGTIPWIRSGEVDGKLVLDSELKITELGLKESSAKLFPVNSVLVAMYGATAGKVGILGIEASTNQAVSAIFPNEKCLPKYLYHLLRSQEETLVGLSVGGAQPNISQTIIKEFEIPLPPIEVQQQIVDELEGYQKIIDGCRQVIENYIPFVDTNSDWDTVDFNESCKVITPTSKIQSNQFLRNGKFPIIDQAKNKIAGYWNNHEDVTEVSVPITMFGDHTRIVKYIETDFVAGADGTKLLSPNETLFLPKFFFYMIGSIEIPNLGYSRHFKELKEKKIPCPPLETQQEIVSKLDRQSELVDGNLELIETFSQKIEDRISKVWGE